MKSLFGGAQSSRHSQNLCNKESMYDCMVHKVIDTDMIVQCLLMRMLSYSYTFLYTMFHKSYKENAWCNI